MAQAGEKLFVPLRRHLDHYVMRSHIGQLRVVPAALGERAGVIGAGLQVWLAADASVRS